MIHRFDVNDQHYPTGPSRTINDRESGYFAIIEDPRNLEGAYYVLQDGTGSVVISGTAFDSARAMWKVARALPTIPQDRARLQITALAQRPMDTNA